MSRKVWTLYDLIIFFFWAPFGPGTVLDAENDKQAGHSACFGQTHIVGRNTKKL